MGYDDSEAFWDAFMEDGDYDAPVPSHSEINRAGLAASIGKHTCVLCGAPAEAAINDDWYCHDGATPTHYEAASLGESMVGTSVFLAGLSATEIRDEIIRMEARCTPWPQREGADPEGSAPHG